LPRAGAAIAEQDRQAPRHPRPLNSTPAQATTHPLEAIPSDLSAPHAIWELAITRPIRKISGWPIAAIKVFRFASKMIGVQT
jgi:hypothetical protein